MQDFSFKMHQILFLKLTALPRSPSSIWEGEKREEGKKKEERKESEERKGREGEGRFLVRGIDAPANMSA